MNRNSYYLNSITSFQVHFRGETLYHYDPLNQLQKVQYPGYTEELFYDKAGNRTKRIAQGVEEFYQYDPRNRLTAYTKNGATTLFRYDHAGNLLADDKARYNYDAFNRTTQVETFDGNIQVNRYDAEGLRHEMEENGSLVKFIFTPDREVIAEQNSLGITRYIRSSELIARNTDAARTYYHYVSDEMGSTTHIVDEDGIVFNHYTYDAWGNLTAQEEAVPNRFKFTGQQLDPVTQQYYLRARFYNPVIARFTQEDTYRGDGLNLYAYCQNNPVFYLDSSGNASQCLKDAYRKHREEGLSATEAYQAAKETYGTGVNDGTSPRDDTLATLKSVRRHVETEMRTDATAQNYLKNGQFERYGTYLHSKVSQYMKSPSIQKAYPELQVNRRLYQNGNRGRYRIPDYQWGKPGESDYQIWDLKPDQYLWTDSKQYTDMSRWTGTNPIQLGYHR